MVVVLPKSAIVDATLIERDVDHYSVLRSQRVLKFVAITPLHLRTITCPIPTLFNGFKCSAYSA
ncbi:MAG: hypothetical protein V7K40_03885 [Nostoc sp.]